MVIGSFNIWTKGSLQKKNQNVNFFQKGGGVNPKVKIVEIEFLMDWKEAKTYRWTQFWQNHKLLNT